MGAIGSAKGSSWTRVGFQVASGMFLAVLLPFMVRYVLADPGEAFSYLYVSAIGSGIALLTGLWIARNITTYPGAEATAYIVPAISISYTLLFIVLIIGRIPYNRALLVSGWIIGAIWYITLFARIQRYRRLRIGVVPPCDPKALDGIATIEAVALVDTAIDKDTIDAVIADLRADLPEEWDAALADYALAGIPVYHLKHLKESLTGRVELEHLSENSFGSLTPLSAFMTFKRMADWVAALIIGVLLLPLFLVVAVIVRVSSPGPILFRQKRMGYRGRIFTVFKFRTMTVENRSGDARNAAMTRDGDDRITRPGAFLRRSRIDELPQIINILRGEMSWIGPRPEAAVLSQWYQEEIPFYRYRHIVVPGLTGWAQVSQGHVTDVTDVTEKLYYDFYYIKNFSLWMDLLIVNRTILTILSGFGAR